MMVGGGGRCEPLPACCCCCCCSCARFPSITSPFISVLWVRGTERRLKMEEQEPLSGWRIKKTQLVRWMLHIPSTLLQTHRLTHREEEKEEEEERHLPSFCRCLVQRYWCLLVTWCRTPAGDWLSRRRMLQRGEEGGEMDLEGENGKVGCVVHAHGSIQQTLIRLLHRHSDTGGFSVILMNII